MLGLGGVTHRAPLRWCCHGHFRAVGPPGVGRILPEEPLCFAETAPTAEGPG